MYDGRVNHCKVRKEREEKLRDHSRLRDLGVLGGSSAMQGICPSYFPASTSLPAGVSLLFSQSRA